MKLLELIENVGPTDSDALDEIDARVWCWLNGYNYKKTDNNFVYYDETTEHKIADFKVAYTRSRDALKSIRPENIDILIGQKEGVCWCSLKLKEIYVRIFCSP